MNFLLHSIHRSRKPSLIAWLFCLLMSLQVERTKAQCTVCTTHIIGIDTLSYTVTTGQTLCIDSIGVLNGNIVLSGGTICNKGVFNPASLTLTSGTIYNYGNAQINSNSTLGSSLTWNNYGGSILNLSGTMTVSGGTVSNDGIMNVETTLDFSSGTFSNQNIINCSTLTGSGTIVNTGIINSN